MTGAWRPAALVDLMERRRQEAQAFADLQGRITAQWSWRATLALMALVLTTGAVFALIAIRLLR